MIQAWHSDIDSSSRCDTYKCYKTLLSLEKYLSIEINFVTRRAMARFRCSNYTLNIEQGRHYNITREDRVCLYCLTFHDNLILENEYHAFFKCPQYEEIRENHCSTGTVAGEIMLHSTIL